MMEKSCGVRRSEFGGRQERWELVIAGSRPFDTQQAATQGRHARTVGSECCECN
jgi:hypothetical protein